MSDFSASEPTDPLADDAIRCNARGCGGLAMFAVRWNNPKVHTADRLKIWAACPDHRESLAEFLRLRGFLRDIVPLADLDGERGQL